MRLNPRWREIILDAYSMRAALAVLLIAVFPDIAYLALGFDIVSPYVRGWFTLLAGVAILIGRVVQQGIEDGSREPPPHLALRRTLHLLGGAVLLCVVMTLLSIWGWIWAVVTAGVS